MFPSNANYQCKIRSFNTVKLWCHRSIDLSQDPRISCLCINWWMHNSVEIIGCKQSIWSTTDMDSTDIILSLIHFYCVLRIVNAIYSNLCFNNIFHFQRGFENSFNLHSKNFPKKCVLMDSACVHAATIKNVCTINYTADAEKGLTHFDSWFGVDSRFHCDRFVRQCSWPFRLVYVRKLISICILGKGEKKHFFADDSMHSIRWSNAANWSSKIVHF